MAQFGSLVGCIDLELAGMRKFVNFGYILELAEKAMSAAAVVVVAVVAGIEMVVGNCSARSRVARSRVEGGTSHSCEHHTSHSR